MKKSVLSAINTTVDKWVLLLDSLWYESSQETFRCGYGIVLDLIDLLIYMRALNVVNASANMSNFVRGVEWRVFLF
jgi:hypothetical protein